MAQKLKFGNGTWATKEGSTLAYNDENGNYKPLPFSVSRASTATRVNKQGLIEVVGRNKARVDYSETSNGALLLEPSRTNLATYSENIPTNFAATDITDTFEYGISPSGLTKSTRLQLSNLGTSRYVYTLTGIVSSGTTYAFSCYYKGTAGETAYIYALPVGGTDVAKEITFTGEWQREYITFTAGASSNYVYIVDSREGGTATDFQVWGTQVEQASYATSYIPTSGSSVTRVADAANNCGNSAVFNDSEGVLYANIAALANDQTSRAISISNGSATTNRLVLQYTNNVGGNQITAFAQATSYSSVLTSSIQDALTNNKFCVKYSDALNSIELWSNGFKINSGSWSYSFPLDSLSKIQFADGNGTGNPFYGKTKELGYYDAILTDAELEYLTSYRSLAEMVTELNLNQL